MQERIDSLSHPGAKETEKAHAGMGARWTARSPADLARNDQQRPLRSAILLSIGTPGPPQGRTTRARSVRNAYTQMYVCKEGAARDTGKPEVADSTAASVSASVWRLSLPEHSGS
jgi:hypothetical protein